MKNNLFIKNTAQCRLLGHEQLETTRCYATPSIEQMRQAMSEGVIKGHEEEPEWKKKEEI